jgi:hypothetical protein
MVWVESKAESLYSQAVGIKAIRAHARSIPENAQISKRTLLDLLSKDETRGCGS